MSGSAIEALIIKKNFTRHLIDDENKIVTRFKVVADWTRQIIISLTEIFGIAKLDEKLLEHSGVDAWFEMEI